MKKWQYKSLNLALALTEQRNVCKTLKLNNYPNSFVNSVKNKRSKKSGEDVKKTWSRSITIPYVRGLSEALQRVFSSLEIRVVHRPISSLRRQLVRVKDPVPPLQQTDVVYCIPCRSCSKVYVGQTSRLLETRLKEHRAAVKYARTDVSAVADHIWNLGHLMNFQDTSILDQSSNQYQRCALESWHIQRCSNINREVGSLPSVYRCLH